MHFSKKKCFQIPSIVSPRLLMQENLESSFGVRVPQAIYLNVVIIFEHQLLAKLRDDALDFIVKKVMWITRFLLEQDHGGCIFSDALILLGIMRIIYFYEEHHLIGCLDQETHWCSKNLRRDYPHPKKNVSECQGSLHHQKLRYMCIKFDPPKWEIEWFFECFHVVFSNRKLHWTAAMKVFIKHDGNISGTCQGLCFHITWRPKS